MEVEPQEVGRRSALAVRETQASAAKSMGIKVTYNEATIPAPPATVGDFTPFVQDIMTSNDGGPPDMVELFLAGIPATLGLLQGLRDAGFEGPILNTQTYDSQLAGPSDTGSVYVQFGAFETAPDQPQVQQMVDDLEAADARLGTGRGTIRIPIEEPGDQKTDGQASEPPARPRTTRVRPHHLRLPS